MMYKENKEGGGAATAGSGVEQEAESITTSSPCQKRLLQNPFSPNESSPFPSAFSAHLSPLLDFSATR